jgi:hypothetical protein
MKTSSGTFDSPDAKPQQISEHTLSENSASEKVSSYFFKEHDNSEISSNQIFNLKKNLVLLMTLAITLAAFLMTACEDEPEYYRTYPTPTVPPPAPMVISNLYPSAGAPGSTVAIQGENFDTSTSDNYVTLGSSYAEILYVTYGVINIRVPMDIQEGDYRIRVSSNGHSADAPQVFSVIRDTK